VFEGGAGLVFRREHRRDSVVSGLTFLLGIEERALECLRLSVLFGELLQLGAAFLGDALVCDVCLLDLLVEDASLRVLAFALGSRLLLLVGVHLFELAVDRDVHLDLLVVLHVFDFVVNQLLLNRV